VVEAAAEALVDTAYAPVWEGRGVPDWFRVGFADLNAPTPKNELLPLVQNAARTGRLFSLETLITADDDTDSLWHAQAYSLVLYMADRLGIAGVRRFADALAEAPDFATAYEGAMDEPLAALLPGWERWLFTSKAAAAYGFVAFQPDTPTPTLTPTQTLTPTPLPPTATPTATASATVTRTPAPPTETPSITPRPAGSLYTPTPTPQPVAPGIVTDVDPLQVGLIAVLLVILVALIVVYIQLGRRT
jgi:cell division septation protein DedD